MLELDILVEANGEAVLEDGTGLFEQQNAKHLKVNDTTEQVANTF